MNNFLRRFITNPKAFIQRASLKYAYKMLPDALNFRRFRGFYGTTYYKNFYEKFDRYSFVVPLGMAYDFMKQRPQHIATHMANYFPVFYYTGALFHNEDKIKNIHKLKENFYLINDGINGNSIFEVKKRIYYLYWPIDHYYYIQNDQDAFVIYDYLDEIDISPRYNTDTIKKHHSLLERANLILTSSTNLYHKVPLHYRDKTLLVTNGVDVEHFAVKHVKKESGKGCVVGYYGALEKWIDIDLIEKIAKDGQFQLKLIGPIIDPRFQRLKSHKNIEMLGHQPYEKLPKLTEDVDIFILPFHINELTKSVSPVKLFEYFATGKPVVSTNLQECRQYDTVLIADEKNIIEQLKKAVLYLGDTDYMQKSQKYAQKNSWSKKVELIEDKIKSLGAI